MSDFVPRICGKSRITLPERDCTECDALEIRVEALEACCDDVKDELDTKLEPGDVNAGEGIVVEQIGENSIRISATGGGGGGGCDCTKADILRILGYSEIDVVMTDTSGTDVTYTFLGMQQIPPTPVCTYTTWITGEGGSADGSVSTETALAQTITPLTVPDNTPCRVTVENVEVGGVAVGDVVHEFTYDSEGGSIYYVDFEGTDCVLALFTAPSDTNSYLSNYTLSATASLSIDGFTVEACLV